MPVPSAVISVPICSDASILSKRARSTLRILPRSGSSLEGAVAAHLGRAAGGIALNDQELRLGGIAFLTVGKFARQGRNVVTLLAREFARLARGLARGGSLHHLVDDRLRLGRMLFEPGVEHVVDHALDYRTHLGRDKLVLGLR